MRKGVRQQPQVLGARAKLMAPLLTLPYGFKDAKVLLLVQSIIGDFLQGSCLIYSCRSIHIDCPIKMQL